MMLTHPIVPLCIHNIILEVCGAWAALRVGRACVGVVILTFLGQVWVRDG